MSSRILILDDEPAICELLLDFLDGIGHSCEAVTAESDALDKLRNEPFDVLITDIVMEGIGGIEVARAAKELLPELVVIVMTGHAKVETAIEALRVGADEYVLKPFEPSEVVVSINRGLEQRDLLRKLVDHEQELEQRVEEATCDLKASHEKLQEVEQYLNSLINSTVDAILTVGQDDKIAFANRGAQRMLGFREEEFLQMPLKSLLSNGSQEFDYLRRVLEVDRPLQNVETQLRHHDGEMIPVSISFSLAPDAQGNAMFMVAICKDITEQKRLESELKEMTIRDSLTGMYNVRYFYERLEMEIDRAKRQGHALSMLLIDVDNFKTFNDTQGHLEGDRVLFEVGRVIEECTREHVDMGFRYGGDEFTVLLPETDEKQALVVANRIVETFALRKFDIVTISLGLMNYDHKCTAKEFMKYTDSVMYEAKRAGGNQVVVHTVCSESSES